MATLMQNRDISAAQGALITAQAQATFPDYVSAKRQFRELGAGETRQEGDLLYWPNHMAIFSTFDNDKGDSTTDRVTGQGRHWTQQNDMWSATHPGGAAYGPAKTSYFKPDAPRVFRYQK